MDGRNRTDSRLSSTPITGVCIQPRGLAMISDSSDSRGTGCKGCLRPSQRVLNKRRLESGECFRMWYQC